MQFVEGLLLAFFYPKFKVKLVVWLSPETGTGDKKIQCLTRVNFIPGDYGEEREEQVLKLFSRKSPSFKL